MRHFTLFSIPFIFAIGLGVMDHILERKRTDFVLFYGFMTYLLLYIFLLSMWRIQKKWAAYIFISLCLFHSLSIISVGFIYYHNSWLYRTKFSLSILLGAAIDQPLHAVLRHATSLYFITIFPLALLGLGLYGIILLRDTRHQNSDETETM